MKKILLMMSLMLVSYDAFSQNHWHVAPNGTPAGDGSIDNPWDIATMFAAPEAVLPGDTILLRGGIYNGHWVNHLSGGPSGYITIKSYPGEMAVLDAWENNPFDHYLGTVQDEGGYCIFRDLMLVNSGGYNQTLIGGSNPENWADASGINSVAPHTKFINLIIHDNIGDAIGFWKPNIAGEISGCIMYQNGWQSDRGHAFAIYTQNDIDSPFKRITGNIFFKEYNFGMKIYGEHGSLANYVVSDNISFLNGMIANREASGIFVGGKGYDYEGAQNIYVEGNSVYNGPTNHFNALEMGYTSDSKHFEISHNTLHGGYSTLKIKDVDDRSQVEDNFIYATNMCLNYDYSVGEGDAGFIGWENNTYFQTPSTNLGFADDLGDAYTSFTQWQSNHPDFDQNSSYKKTYPKNNIINIYKNEHEDKRGHVAVFNYQDLDNVLVDISSLGFEAGDLVVVYDVENLVDENIVLETTYHGNLISLPMDLTECVPSPEYYKPLTHSSREFNAFLIVSRRLQIPVIEYVSRNQACTYTIDNIANNNGLITVDYTKTGSCDGSDKLGLYNPFSGIEEYIKEGVNTGETFNMLDVAPDAGNDDIVLRIMGESSYVESSFYYESPRPFGIINAKIEGNDRKMVTLTYFDAASGHTGYGYSYDSNGNLLEPAVLHYSIPGVNTIFFYGLEGLSNGRYTFVVEAGYDGLTDTINVEMTDNYGEITIFDWSPNPTPGKSLLEYYKSSNYGDYLTITNSANVIVKDYVYGVNRSSGNISYVIDLSDQPDGVYSVEVTDGLTSASRSITKTAGK
jgi:hypothetical protein